ncbi:Flp pilus assembly complex ATPase component TadA [candidate division KSB1 bacterium]|nr:Flp pilus assembly complex ATPase component TadA [candidate division KSB1 bacterium]
MSKIPTKPSEHCPGISAELDKVILKSLEKDPKKRYQSAKEMQDAIEASIASDSTIVIKSNEAEATVILDAPPEKSSPKKLLFGIGGAVAALAVAFYFASCPLLGINCSDSGQTTNQPAVTTITKRAAPILFSPAGGGVLTNAKPTFIWSAISGAAISYALEYSVDNSFNQPTRIENITDSTFTLTAGLGNGQYFWRIQAQDGFIQRKIDGFYIRFRVSVIPIVGAEFDRRFESVVIRVLDDRKVITDLAKIGLQEQALKDFRKSIEQPQGIIILTGPTGSGKSTTLVAALSHVMDATKNVLTIEEPVEYLIQGARQIKLSQKLTFDSALRSILRHDPDIVMVGEIRDLKSAEIAISLANTGHLTFSTLHTNDAPSAISRLYMLGAEPFLIANAINLVMAQRLVRKLCDNCKSPVSNPDPDHLLRLGFTKNETANTTFYTNVGCDECWGGFKGRIAISEALLFNSEIRKEIIKTSGEVDEETMRAIAQDNGMLSLRDSGKERVKNGLTTLQEVIDTTMEV